MKISILVDLNVILDVLLERPGYRVSQTILEEGTNRYTIFISGHTVTTFAYLLEHAKVPNNEIKRNISWMLSTFSVVATSNDILNSALKSSIADYEDAVIEQAALDCKASTIVTRNIKDFAKSAVPALTPENFV
ncbi:MAG: PIN domain-containing protein [Candidatus Saccharimonadales bacterium]